MSPRPVPPKRRIGRHVGGLGEASNMASCLSGGMLMPVSRNRSARQVEPNVRSTETSDLDRALLGKNLDGVCRSGC